MTQPATKPTLKLFVPGKAVSVNAAYRVRGRRVYLSFAALEWKEAVYYAVLDATPVKDRQHFFKTDRLSISYTVQGVKGDADNYAKLLFDGIKAALKIDDKHFQVASAKVEPDVLPPGVWIEISEVAE